MARIIRWVGHPSPLYDHNISSRIRAGTMPAELVLAMEDFEHNRKISVNRGRSEFRVGPEHGYSRPYVWGPRYFDVQMEEKDWARLCKNPLERFQFLDVTNGPPPVRPLLKFEEWRQLLEAAKYFPPPQSLIPPGRW